MRTWATLLAIVLLNGVAINDALSIVPRPVEFGDVVGRSSEIVLAEVTERTPVNFVFGGEEHTCGTRYVASIERTFKSELTTVEFFDPSTEQPLPLGSRILALLFKHDLVEAEALVRELNVDTSDLKGSKLLCQLRSSSLAVKESPRTLFRFFETRDGKAAIMVPEGAPILPYEIISEDPTGVRFVHWQDLEGEIKHDLEVEGTR